MSVDVSILLPTYGHELEDFRKSFSSACLQEHSSFEVIVVSDNDPDSALAKRIARFMNTKISDRVHYIQNPTNMGGGLSRNIAAQKARGTWLSFLDDDDLYSSQKIARQQRFAQQGGYDLVFSNLELINTMGEYVDYREFRDLPSSHGEELLRYHLRRHMTGTSTFFIKRESFERMGGFGDLIVAQEFDLMIRAIEGGLKVGYLDEDLVCALRHQSGGITSGEGRIKKLQMIYDRTREYDAILTKDDLRYIDFRHTVLLMFEAKKKRKYLPMLGYFVKAMSCDPRAPFEEYARRRKNARELKKNRNQ